MPKFSPWLRAAPVCWLLSAAWAVAQQNAAPAEREAARKALDDVKKFKQAYKTMLDELE